MTDADYADDRALLLNTPAQAKTLLHSQEQAGYIGLHVNANKTELVGFKPKGVISSRSGEHQKLVKQFTYLGSYISSTESDDNIRLATDNKVMTTYA